MISVFFSLQVAPNVLTHAISGMRVHALLLPEPICCLGK